MTLGPRPDVLVNVIIPAVAAERRPLPECNTAGSLLLEGICQRWRTDNPAQDVTRPESSEYLCSSFDFPNWCNEPSYLPLARGFQIWRSWALIRWDVAGGFQHV